ncbi:hypothetical protein J3E69DRAFT_373520 [Trichoderma sp. SZMC 28015]
MAHLTTLPNEILHNILQWLAPKDLESLPRVCKALHSFVKGNQKLCEDIYIHHFDSPPDDDARLDWETELHDIVKLENICHRDNVEDKEGELSFVYKVVTRLLKHASPASHAVETSDTQYASRNADFLNTIFEDESNRKAFLQKSSLFERVYRTQHHPFPALDKKQQQESAKLHCLYGKPILETGRLRSARTYPYACSKVYDIRQYTNRTRWGPFMDEAGDLKVDWEKVEAILIVLGSNIYTKKLTRLFNDVWDSPFSGSWKGSFISSPITDQSSLDAMDPYGVTGTWYRIVCFLDYNDFFSYNFTNPERDESPLHTLDVGEATRLIIMRIHVTKIEQAGPDSEYSSDLPIVHYEGISRPLDDSWDDNASSDLRGTVGLTKEGEVRWTSVSIFQGHERWKSEGVQLSGPKSGKVIGNWFDRDYDPHGPCGPSAFWKASDSETAHGTHAVLPRNFLLWSALIQMEDSDPEGDMEYTMENEEEEEEDDSESEPVANELPELLLDAELEIIEITHHIEDHPEPSSGA